MSSPENAVMLDSCDSPVLSSNHAKTDVHSFRREGDVWTIRDIDDH